MPPRLSIIVPTVFRGEEFLRFLHSLETQSALASIELIVVDQNTDDRVSRYLAQDFLFPVKHIRAEKISLSYAKNKGLEAANGMHCCFLDDDCWLDQDFLKNIFSFLDRQPLSGLLLKAVTPQGEFLVPSKLHPGFKLYLNNIKESFYAPQIAQVYPTNVAKEVGGFNENLGIGTEFGSAEDTDMLVRIVKKGVGFHYLDQVQLFHPEVDYSSMTPQKSYQYGLGFGAFCRIHGWAAYWWYKMFRSLLASAFYLMSDSRKSKSYASTLKGRWIGYRNWGKLE